MNTQFIKRLEKDKISILGKNFFSEQFNAAIEILKIFASRKKHTNHAILSAPTQTGKTSVMQLLYRILNYMVGRSRVCDRYGIKKVIYLTSDNGSGKGSLKNQTMNRFDDLCNTYSDTLKIEFLKRSDLDRYDGDVSDTMILVDESQYGWREVQSVCQRFFQKNGINFRSCDDLERFNTYVVSVSATTQNERFGDSVMKYKPIVKLKPGKGYVGYDDFFECGMIKPVTDEQFINTYDKYSELLGLISKKLKKIYRETGIAKCAILRIYNNKKNNFYTDSDEFIRISNDKGFTVENITYNEAKIDYVQIQNSIYTNSGLFEANGKKFHLLIIKNAFSYGITIRPEIKKLIGFCYDVRKDVFSTEATEQGLLGRMTGYYDINLINGLNIYINETHYNGIKETTEGNNPYSSPMIPTSKCVKVKCSRKKWDGNISNIVVWNNEKCEPLVLEGKKVDDFFNENKDKLPIDELFDKEHKCDTYTLSKIRDLFIKEVRLPIKLDKKMNIDTRRCIKDNDPFATKALYSNPMITHHARTKWKSEENEGRTAFSFIIDIRKANKRALKGIEILIAYGNVGFATIKEEFIYKSRKKKVYSGYDTTLNVKNLVAETSYI